MSILAKPQPGMKDHLGKIPLLSALLWRRILGHSDPQTRALLNAYRKLQHIELGYPNHSLREAAIREIKLDTAEAWVQEAQDLLVGFDEKLEAVRG